MDDGAILIGLAVLIVAAFLIGQPLLDRRQPREPKLSEAGRLREQRDRILVTLRDLDFDHAGGKIQDEDYTPLRAKLVTDGAAVLKQLDELTPAAPDQLESQLEQAIAARRRGHTPTAGSPMAADSVEQAIAAHRKPRPAAASGETTYCPQCGQAALAGDKFCAKCGTELRAAPSTKDAA